MQWIKINEISTIYSLHWCSLTKEKQNYKHLRDKKSYQLICLDFLLPAVQVLKQHQKKLNRHLNWQSTPFAWLHLVAFIRFFAVFWDTTFLLGPPFVLLQRRGRAGILRKKNPAVSSLSVDFLRKGRPQMPSAAWADCDHKTRVSLTQGRREWRGQNMCLPACPRARCCSASDRMVQASR